MTTDKVKIKEKNIQELATRMGLVTVENMCHYTIPQLVYMVANKVNELIGEVDRFESDVFEVVKTQNENIQYLLGEGLHSEVATIFENWMEDGTFNTLINQTAFKKVNERLDITNAQLSDIEDNKMDKGGEIVVSQINKNKGKLDQTYMTDEFLSQIRGDAPLNAVIANGGVTTEKLADFSVNNKKIQTPLQPITILSGKDNELPNFDSVNKLFTIPQGGYDHIIYVGGKAYSGVRDVSVDLTMSSSAGKLVFNTSTKLFRACNWNDGLDDTTEVVVAYFRYADKKYVVNMPCRHTIDGKTPITSRSLSLNHFESEIESTLNHSILSINGQSIDINDVSLWEVGGVSIDNQTWEKAKSSNNATDRIRMVEVMPIDCGTYKIKTNSSRKLTYKLYKDLTSGAIDCPTWFTNETTLTVPIGGGYIGFLIQASSLDVIEQGETVITIIPSFEQLKNDVSYLKENSVENNKTSTLNSVKMVAHRGLSYFYPENTITSFYKACEYGFKMIETDIEMTSDGHFVIMHDETVDRTTSGTGKVSDLTLSQIRQLTITGGNGIESYQGLRVPTLEEFLQLCKERGVTPVLELKANVNESDIVRFLDILKKYGFESSAYCIGRNTSTLEKIRKLNKDITVQMLLDLTKANIDYCADLGANTHINVSYKQVTKDLVDYAHTKNVKVNCWTVNNVYDYQDLMLHGVDYITTDYLMHNHLLSLSVKEMYKVNSGDGNMTITIPSPTLNHDVYEVSVEVLHKSGGKPYLKSWGYQMNYPENASGWVQLKMMVHARTQTIYVKADNGDFEFRNFKVIHHKM